MIENKIYVFGNDCLQQGIGYWAASIECEGETKVITGVNPHSTGNRMLLTAAIEAIGQIDNDAETYVYCVENYLAENAEVYLQRWIRNGWKKSDGKYIKNIDLWGQLAILLAERKVTFIKIDQKTEALTKVSKAAEQAHKDYKNLVMEDLAACL